LSLYYSFERGKEIKLGSDDVDDMVRGFSFLGTDQKVILAPFLKAFGIATKIHEERIELRDNGHPQYQNSEKILNDDSKGVKEEVLLHILEDTQKDLSRWKETKEKCLERVPRLLLFNNSQLLGFMRRTLDSLVSASKRGDKVVNWNPIMPYLKLIFSKEDWLKIVESLNLSVQKLKLLERVDQLEERILDICSELIFDLQEHLGVDIEQFGDKGTALVYNASRLTERQQEILLLSDVYSYEIPLPYQLFECYSTSMVPQLEDFRIFLKRASKFTDLKFTIFGVNFLPSQYKEELVKMLLDETLPRELALIFTQDISVEMFTFVKRADFTLQSENDFKKAIAAANLLDNCKIKTLQHVSGRPGDGKTTYIASEAKKIINNNPQSKFVIVSVNENFKPSMFHEKIRFDDTITTAVVHFNISAFGSFFSFHQMIRRLFFSGFLIDDEIGDIEMLSPTISWTIYVEIPCIIPQISDKPVIEYLPLI